MHVALRADGGPKRGYGHLSRTATLARELFSRGHTVTYLTRTPDAVEEVRPSGVGVVTVDDADSVADADSTAEVESITEFKSVAEADLVAKRVGEIDADALVVDLGDLPVAYQQRLDEAVTPFALLSDQVGATVCCDLFVNGHIYASRDQFEWVGTEPEWCLGGEYQLFEESFRGLADREPPDWDPPERALILMGGSDPGNATPAALRAFDGRNFNADDWGLNVEVVIGPGFQNHDEIAATAESVGCSVSLVHAPDDLAERMFRADLAVTALGLTAYELAVAGTPYVGIVQAEDQRPKATALANAGAALVVDSTDEFSEAVTRLTDDQELRRRLRRRAKNLVRAGGTRRVCDRLETLA